MHAEHERRQARADAAHLFDELEAAHPLQRDVRNHQIPFAGSDLFEGGCRVSGFAHYRVLDAIDQYGSNAVARHGVIVNEEYPSHRVVLVFCPAWASGVLGATGTSIDTTVPFPLLPEMRKTPPINAVRSRMPSKPIAFGSSLCASVMPRPLSRMLNSKRSVLSVNVT